MSVTARGLSVSFGALDVLAGVDLTAAQGEFVGVTGPSGCGKTTLLHAVAGLLAPRCGEVRSDGGLSFVFQRPTLMPWRTAAENVAFGLECRGAAKGEASERARELLGRVGMADFAGRWPRELSEGMKQRVSLARALAVRPRLLLADEPFSALDSKARRELQDLLLEFWARERFTVLFVSHWAEELAYLADRVIVLSARPSLVRKIVPIALPRPRGSDAAFLRAAQDLLAD